jgi:hypothetical protein
MDAYECLSRPKAHELLLRLLGEFQLPMASLEQRDEFGDVAFAAPNGEVILFARANLVFLLRNAERVRVPVNATAARFDNVLIRKPEAAASARTARRIESSKAETEGARVGQPFVVDLDLPDDPEAHTSYKLFASAGEVWVDQGKVVYQADAAGEHEISAYPLRGQDPGTRKAVRLRVQ